MQLISNNHDPYDRQVLTCKPIVIKDGAWLCARSTVLAGSEIGLKSIIAAGAVVKGTVEDLELVGGVPAKHIKFLV